jgi:hypothetical protein
VQMPSIVHSELPVHSVAGWEASDSMVAHKSMTLMQLVYDHPTGAKVWNRQGKTPLETGTAWDNGV